MSKVVSKKTKNIESKAKTTKSKKLSVKMKAVIASAVSVVCVAAITLGLVFGLRKPDGTDPKVDFKFSASQQLLANEINSNVKYDVFDIVDKVPYSQYTTIDQLTRYGDSYFAYTDSYGNEQFFVYWKNAQGNYQTRCLTDQQGFVDGTALSYAVEKMNGDYLVIANYYTNAQYKEEITNIRYDLISIKDPANPKVIFRFDTRGMDCHVNKSDIVLKDNYFAFTYIDNINYEAETVDYNTYFYAYSDEPITHSPTHENNFVGGLTQSKTERVRRVFNDSGFTIISGTSQTYYYIVDGEFKSIEREIVIGNNSQVETEWNFIEISESKLLVEKVDYLADQESAVETTIKAESEEQLGSYTYSNKSYEIFGIKDGVAENMNFKFKPGYASVGKIDVTDKMTNSMFALVYQKVSESNELVDEYLIAYYDAEGKTVVEYESTNSGEQIVYASNNTFVTTKNILQPQNSVEAKKLFDFSDKDYHIDSDLNINSNYVALNSDDDTKAGVIDVWGKLILDPETSGYSRILDLVDNRCVVFDIETEKGYTVNLKTGEAVELENYDRSPLITGSATGLNLSKNASTQLSQIKNIYGTVVAEDVTELKYPSAINGFEVIEVWTNNDSAKPTSYLVFSKIGKDETASHTSYTKGGDVATYQNDFSSADPYTETWSYTYANGSLTETEDPVYGISFHTNGYGISTSSDTYFSVKLDGTTYKLSSFKSYIGASYQERYDSTVRVSYNNDNGATFVTAPHGYGYDWKYSYSWKYDFSCWVWVWESYADYVHKGGSYLVYTSVSHYTYFRGTNLWNTDFDSTTHNRVNTMTYDVKTVTTSIPDALREDNTTPESDWVRYGHLSYWRISGNGTSGNIGGAWYGPSSYNDSNVANSNYSLCNNWSTGSSYWITYGAYFNCYIYAYYVQNTYNLNVDGSRKNTSLGTNKWSSAIYYPSKTGYNFTGWEYSGFKDCTHHVRYYKSDGTYTTEYFYNTSNSTSGSIIPYKAGYSYIKICYSAPYDSGYGFTASLTAKYTPKIYTISLVQDSTKTITNSGTTAVYYKYDSGFYLDSACTTYPMTTTTNPITHVIAVGYKVESPYTLRNPNTGGTLSLTQASGYLHDESSGSKMNGWIESLGIRSASSTWSAITYTIQYPRGCTLDGSNTDTTMTVKYGAVASVPAPVGLYYDFNGFKITGASNGHTHYYGNTTSANTSYFTSTSKDLKGYPSYVYFKNLWGTVDASKAASESHGTVTLTGNWLGKRYNVQYVMNGGQSIATHQERYGEVASINGTVYKVGYNFAGWDVTGMDTVSHSFYAVENATITETTTVSTTTATLGEKYKNCEFSSLRGTYGSNNAVQTVTFSARWTPITYYITYSLTNGSNESGKWAATEAHPSSAVYEQSFAIDIPDREGWPTGYDFVGWTITGLGSGAKYCATQDGTYSNLVSGNTTSKSIDVTSRYYFKDLAADEGDTVNFQARWSSHEYNISYVANGERVTLSTSSVTKLKYDENGRVYKPTRPGYTFAGWSLSSLSDEITHYYHTGSSWVASSQVSFESTNGKYLNPSNPNVYTLLGTGTYFRVKNLHLESGATVVLTANWTPLSYTITYHYTTDADYSSYPTTNTLNTVSSQSHTKTQTVVFDQYFKTYSVGAADTTTTVVAPTGHRISGWFIVMNGSLGTSVVTTTQASTDPGKVCLPNTDYLLNYAFTDAHLQSGTTALSNMHAYAIYEIITITLKYYVPVDASNDLSTYNFETQATTSFGGNLTLATYNTGSTYVTNWLVSTNLYVDGVMFNSRRTITYNSVSRYTYAGINLNWGLSNIYAHDPENPVFYLYGEVNPEYDARSLSKLSFTKITDATYGDYWSVAKDSSYISGAVYIPNRYNSGTNDLPVRKVKASGFSAASSMTSVYIPKNIETIDSSAFVSCTGLTSVTYEADSKLRTINSYAFSSCTSLVSFAMPNSVTTLGSGAFSSCSKLESLTLSTSLTTLPSGFINYAPKLTSVTIPNSVTTINAWAFDYCYLTSLTIPASVTSFGAQELAYDTLASITVDSANKYYDSRNNCNAIIKKDDGTLLLGCKNTIIPEDVKYIGDYAFHATSWSQGETAVLPEGVIAIGSDAFEETKFNEIILPSTLTEIGSYAFYDSDITEIILPSSISFIGDQAFYYSDLTSIYIPGDNNPYIGYEAFASCYGLKTVIFGYGVQYIYSYTTYDCGDLDYVYIPSTVQYIEEGAIYGSSNLKIYVGQSEGYTTGWDSTWWSGDVYYYDTPDSAMYEFLSMTYSDWTFRSVSEDWIMVSDYHGSDYLNLKIPAFVDEVYFDYSDTSSALDSTRTLYVGTNVQSFTYRGDADGTRLRELTLSPGLRFIGEYGFDNLANISSINIPYTVEAIGSSVFRGCEGLNTITVDENNPYYASITNTIVHLESKAVIAGSGCSTIPTTLAETIFDYSFQNVTMTEIRIPGNIKTISPYAFYAITTPTVVLDEGVESVQSNAFALLYSSTGVSVSLPASLKKVSEMAFTGTVSSISVASGNTVYDSRDNCNAVVEKATNTLVLACKATTISSTVTAIGKHAFHTLSMPASFTIPTSVTFIDDHAFFKTTFAGNISTSNVTKIAQEAFAYSAFNGTLTLGSKLVEIGYRAFYEAKLNNQTSLEFPSSVTMIGSESFSNVEASIVFNSGLYHIGVGAFANNDTATTIEIPDSVREIKSSAFAYMTSLTSIDFGTNITKIPDRVCAGNTALTEIIIPENVTTIGVEAFYNCTNVTGTVVIPDKVTSIGNYAFYYLGYNEDVDVVFGKNITTIGRYAFAYSGIKKIELGDKVTSIGDYGFYNSKKLTYANLGNGAMSIGACAFHNCSTLVDVVFSSNLTAIGINAFSYCSALKAVNLPWSSSYYIGNYAFEYCTSLTSVEIPSFSVSVGYYAFRYCSALKYVWLDSGISTIYASGYSNAPFYNCNSSITIYTNATSRKSGWGSYFNYRSSSAATTNYNSTIATYFGAVYAGFSFSGSYGSLTLSNYTGSASVVYVPSIVKTIGSMAFDSNTTITKVVIPHGVTSLEIDAFEDCSNLVEAILPQSLTSIGSWAFNRCYKLVNVTIPSSVTSIDSYAFGSTAITSIYIPKSVTYINASAFYNCTKLESIIVDEENSVYDSRNNCNAIIQSVDDTLIRASNNTVIPSTVKVIGAYAFMGATQSSISLSENVITINSNAFYSMPNLTSVVMTNVYTIGSYAFYNSSKLSSVTLNEGVDSIGSYAFAGTSALTSIVIPNTVTYLGDSAFASSGLTSVNIPNGISMIYDYTFANTKLTSVHIPANVESIGYSAFFNVTTLQTVTMENGVTYIDGYAFQNCTNLVTVNMSAYVTQIGDGVFYNCSKLKNFVMPAGVTSIGANAFYNCDALTAIWVPSSASVSASSYSYSPFYGCATTVKIYTDAPSKRSAWGTYWNYYASGSTLTTYFSNTYATYFKTMYPNFTVTTNGSTVSLSSYTGSETTVNVPHGITTISGYAFNGKTSITTINLPSSMNNLMDGAFASLSGLQTLNFAEGLREYNLGAVIYTNVLSTINLPSTVTSIVPHGNISFYSSLTAVNFNSGSNFYEVTDGYLIEKASKKLVMPINRSLTSYTIPNYVTEIGDYAFYQICSVTSHTIPVNVVRIGKRAFAGTTFNTITFTSGSKLKIIDDYAFYSNYIASITLPEGLEIIGHSVFETSYTSSGITISIPSTVKSVGYKIATNNVGSITVSSSNAYYSSTDGMLIEKATNRLITGKSAATTIPSTVKTIAPYAFFGMLSGTSFTIPANVVSIGMNAFESNTKLTTLTFSEGLKEIGMNAFNACSKIASITLPNSLEHIDRGAFKACSALKTVYIGDNVKYIAGATATEGAFYSTNSSIVFYCADLEKPKGWETYWCYRSTSAKGTIVWGYGSAAAASASAYSVSSVDTGNTGYYENVSYSVENAVNSVSNNHILLSSDKNSVA